MKFVCSQQGLLAGIRKVQKAISTKTTLPILEGVLIEAKDKKLKMTATDLDMGIETYVQAVIGEEGAVVINARLLGDIVGKLSGQLEFTTEDNKVIITSGRSKFNLVSQTAIEFPELPAVELEKTYELDQAVFREMINQTSFAASKDESRPVLTGVYFEIKEGELNLVALDAYRMTNRKCKIDNVQDIEAIIPAKSLNEVAKLLSGTGKVKIISAKNHIVIDLADTKVTIRLMEGQYIDYRRLIPVDYKTKLKVKTTELAEGIDRVSLLAKEGKTNLIKCEINNKTMSLVSNSQTGSVNEEIGIEMQEGEGMQIAFNATYFSDVVKVLDSEYVEMEFTASVQPILLKKSDSTEYTYMVLPIRLVA